MELFYYVHAAERITPFSHIGRSVSTKQKTEFVNYWSNKSEEEKIKEIVEFLGMRLHDIDSNKLLEIDDNIVLYVRGNDNRNIMLQDSTSKMAHTLSSLAVILDHIITECCSLTDPVEQIREKIQCILNPVLSRSIKPIMYFVSDDFDHPFIKLDARLKEIFRLISSGWMKDIGLNDAYDTVLISINQFELNVNIIDNLSKLADIKIIATTKDVKLMGKNIGKFRITYPLFYPDKTTFTNITYDNTIRKELDHPHIHQNVPCWGGFKKAVERITVPEIALRIFWDYLHQYQNSRAYREFWHWYKDIALAKGEIIGRLDGATESRNLDDNGFLVSTVENEDRINQELIALQELYNDTLISCNDDFDNSFRRCSGCQFVDSCNLVRIKIHSCQRRDLKFGEDRECDYCQGCPVRYRLCNITLADRVLAYRIDECMACNDSSCIFRQHYDTCARYWHNFSLTENMRPYTENTIRGNSINSELHMVELPITTCGSRDYCINCSRYQNDERRRSRGRSTTNPDFEAVGGDNSMFWSQDISGNWHIQSEPDSPTF